MRYPGFNVKYTYVPTEKSCKQCCSCLTGFIILILLNVSLLTLMHASLDEKDVVDGHGGHTALHFCVKAKENQKNDPTLYCLPKPH